MSDRGNHRHLAHRIEVFDSLQPKEVECLVRHGKLFCSQQGRTLFHVETACSILFVMPGNQIGITRRGGRGRLRSE